MFLNKLNENYIRIVTLWMDFLTCPSSKDNGLPNTCKDYNQQWISIQAILSSIIIELRVLSSGL
jgi:hypothetical protein